MKAHVQTMLDRMSGLIHSGDYTGVTEYFDTPLSLHMQGEVLVFRSRLTVCHALQSIVAQQKSDCIQAVRWHLTAQEMVRDGRFRLWVRWDHVYRDRTVEAATDITYFCRMVDARISVEMLQYRVRPVTKLALPRNRLTRSR